MKKLYKIFVWVFVIAAAASWFVSIFNRAPEETPQDKADFFVVAENLQIPWEVAFLPPLSSGQADFRMLVTERPGRLLLLSADGSEREVLLSGVGTHRGEGGLLGVAVHPDFDERGWIYLYFSEEKEGGRIENSVWQYWFADGELMTPAPIIEGIPGSAFHDGGRIAFGPPQACAAGQADCYLYITTGDAGSPELAQDTSSLAGKILRIDSRGEIPPDNPFGNAVWSYGHRNPQGLAWDSEGRLWATEHGRSGALSGFDELNLIEKGANYGWPEIQGDEQKEGMRRPVLHSGPDKTWAPAGAAFYGGKIFWSGLRGGALYEAEITPDGEARNFKANFEGQFGRLRAAVSAPDGFLYVTTSNTDGRGKASAGDDKIIKIKLGNGLPEHADALEIPVLFE